MSVSTAQASKARQRTSNGDIQDATLDATNTTADLILGITAEKVTYTMNGTLTGNISFSINGKDFYSSTALAATGVPTTYNTHLVKVVRITRTAGSGQVVVACK